MKRGSIIGLSAIVIIIAIYFTYQIVVVNPRNALAEQNAEFQQTQEVAAEKQTQLTSCLNLAEKNYSEIWGVQCATLAGQDAGKFITCTQTYSSDYCNQHYPIGTGSISSCSLPTATAEELNNQLNIDKSDCIKQFGN